MQQSIPVIAVHDLPDSDSDVSILGDSLEGVEGEVGSFVAL
jgi:hypothetical protein